MSIVLGLNNSADTATLASDTTWVPTLPLTNLQSYLLPKPARTTKDDVFTLTATLAEAAMVGVVMLAGHNLGRTAKVTVKCYLAATLVDGSGEMWAWPQVGGALIKASAVATMRGDTSYFLPANMVIDKVEVTVDDTSNADTYIQIGRLFVGAAFDSALPVEYGNATVAYKSLSEIQTVPAGIKYFTKRRPLRSATVAYKELTEDEMVNTVFDALRLADLTGEVIFSYMGRPAYEQVSGVNAVSLAFHSRCFLGNFVELNPISHAFYNAYAVALAIDEVAL